MDAELICSNVARRTEVGGGGLCLPPPAPRSLSRILTKLTLDRLRPPLLLLLVQGCSRFSSCETIATATATALASAAANWRCSSLSVLLSLLPFCCNSNNRHNGQDDENLERQQLPTTTFRQIRLFFSGAASRDLLFLELTSMASPCAQTGTKSSRARDSRSNGPETLLLAVSASTTPSGGLVTTCDCLYNSTRFSRARLLRRV